MENIPNSNIFTSSGHYSMTLNYIIQQQNKIIQEHTVLTNIINALSNGELIQTSLLGNINNINRIFTTPTKYVFIIIYKNGLLLSKNEDYIEINDETIEFVDAPLNTEFIDKLQIIYKEK